MSGKWTPKSAEPIGYIAQDTPVFFAKYGAATVSTGMISRPNPRENVPVYLHPDSAIVSELAKALEAMVERFGHDIFTMPAEDRDLLTRAVNALAKAKGDGA